MATVNKRSSILIIITICLLILLSSGGIYTIYITYTIKPDAEIINKLGIIRGSIQRLVKLELSGHETGELLDSIDAIIIEFTRGDIKVHDQNGEIQNSLDNLYLSWLQLKEVRDSYKENPSIGNKQALIEKSEKLWSKANSTVFVSQLVSERKIEKYRISFIFLTMNLALVILIIFLIKRYVKDNLEYLVNYDGLTNVYNRRHFYECLGSEIFRSQRYHRSLSFIMFDIDHFKRINDTYGHDIGDSVLKELSQLIQNNIRKCDILSRLGGEEFGILSPETKIEDAYALSEKLRKIVENHTFKYVGRITISLGITQSMQGDNIDSIYKRADTALYTAKNRGRNRSEIHDLCLLDKSPCSAPGYEIESQATSQQG